MRIIGQRGCEVKSKESAGKSFCSEVKRLLVGSNALEPRILLRGALPMSLESDQGNFRIRSQPHGRTPCAGATGGVNLQILKAVKPIRK